MPHCSPHVIVFHPAQMHGKVSTLRTKSCFHNFLTINHDTAVKTHKGRQKIQSSPNQLPGAMAGSEVGQISFWRKEKVLTNAPGCLAAGADTLRAHPRPEAAPALPPLHHFPQTHPVLFMEL